MIIERGETRTLYSWLVSQERVMRLWIREIAAAPTWDVEFVRKLEEHHQWLLSQIDELAQRAA